MKIGLIFYNHIKCRYFIHPSGASSQAFNRLKIKRLSQLSR